MTEQTSTTTPATQAGSLVDRTVCLAITRGKFGNHRKASVATLTDGATVVVDKKLISASKRLLDSDELKAITKLDGEVVTYLSGLALPSMFRSGVHLIPIPLVQRVDEDLRAFKARRADLVDAFVAAYPRLITDIEARLGGMFNALDYPPADRVRAMFLFEWQYVTFGVPGSLKAIKASLFEDEKNKYAKKLEEASAACQTAMRVGLFEVVAKMSERLTDEIDPATGERKRKVFKKSTIDNLSAFLKTFELRNVTDDVELATLVGKARQLMNGVDPDVLRDKDNESIRKVVGDGFAAIAASLETMGVDRQSRSIDLFDDM